ncbi:MAG: hypothetical protein ACUZ77_10275 [Candidatus Brocadiales bacterium]
MFEEDIFKDAKYCVPCNKFYVTDHCPFCATKTTTSISATSDTQPTYNSSTGLNINNIQPPPAGVKEPHEYKKSNLASKVEEMSLEIERLQHENKEKIGQMPKAKELELKFNILAEKFDRLSQKEKEHREQTFQEPSKRHWFGKDNVKTKRLKGGNVHSIAHDNGKNAETKLLKERVKELNDELERLQQRNEEKDQQVFMSIAEASKLNGVTEQQKDELERLRFDIQERDRVIMQISLTLSSAISQTLAQRGQEKLQEFTPPRSSPTGTAIKRNKRSRKALYAVLGGLNAAIIGYLGWAFLYKNGTINFIVEFFNYLLNQSSTKG